MQGPGLVTGMFHAYIPLTVQRTSKDRIIIIADLGCQVNTPHKIGFIILARMSSQRLPGKALAQAGGQSILAHVAAGCRFRNQGQGELVLATTDQAADAPLAEAAAALGLPCFRGNAEDVAGRLLACAEAYHFDAFFRVNGDSPFTDPDLFSTARDIMVEAQCDFVSNIIQRSYPYGVSVELLRRDFFAEIYRRFATADEREHVTPWLYGHLDQINHRSLPLWPDNLPGLRMTIDQPADLEFFRQFLARRPATAPRPSLSEAIDYYQGRSP